MSATSFGKAVRSGGAMGCRRSWAARAGPTCGSALRRRASAAGSGAGLARRVNVARASPISRSKTWSGSSSSPRPFSRRPTSSPMRRTAATGRATVAVSLPSRSGAAFWARAMRRRVSGVSPSASRTLASTAGSRRRVGPFPLPRRRAPLELGLERGQHPVRPLGDGRVGHLVADGPPAPRGQVVVEGLGHRLVDGPHLVEVDGGAQRAGTTAATTASTIACCDAAGPVVASDSPVSSPANSAVVNPCSAVSSRPRVEIAAMPAPWQWKCSFMHAPAWSTACCARSASDRSSRASRSTVSRWSAWSSSSCSRKANHASMAFSQ